MASFDYGASSVIFSHRYMEAMPATEFSISDGNKKVAQFIKKIKRRKLNFFEIFSSP